MPSELISIVELPLMDAELRLSLLGFGITEQDRTGADCIRRGLAANSLRSIVLGRDTLLEYGGTEVDVNAISDSWRLLSRSHVVLKFESYAIEVTDHSTNGTGILHYENNSAVDDPVRLQDDTLVIGRDDIAEPHDLALLLPLKTGLFLELRFTTY